MRVIVISAGEGSRITDTDHVFLKVGGTNVEIDH